MKKNIGTSFEKDFKSPRLYLDDLKAIEEIFLTELKAEHYEIRTKEYKYTSYKEILGDYKGNLFDIRIGSFTPHISISLTKYNSNITCYDHDLQSIGATQKIYTIIKKRERVIYWFMFEKLYFIFFSSVLLPYLNVEKHIWILYLIIPLFGITIINFVMRSLDIYKASKIELYNINDKDNFFRRNKDAIILTLFSGFIGATLGVIGTILANYFDLLK